MCNDFEQNYEEYYDNKIEELEKENLKLQEEKDALETRICNIESCLDRLFDGLAGVIDKKVLEESWKLLDL